MSSMSAITLDPVDPAVRAAAHDLADRLADDSEVERVVRSMLVDIAEGSRVVVMRTEDEVTPTQAADMIGVTRQFVDRLCADGVLPYRHLPGSKHRRIRVQDVVDLASERESRRRGGDALRTAMGGAGG
ncbi:MAG: helix-turn-helix domain-containing protein [Propionibacteriaceae bacterium]|nr:helix-turn-helix domain-containing protein [Propionibacteriaceae bacterium]